MVRTSKRGKLPLKGTAVHATFSGETKWYSWDNKTILLGSAPHIIQIHITN